MYGSTVICSYDHQLGQTVLPVFPKSWLVGNESDLNTLSPFGRFLSWCRLSRNVSIARCSAAQVALLIIPKNCPGGASWP